MAHIDLSFLHSLLSENEDTELYFALLTFKETAFISNTFLTCCPHCTAASRCKEIITAQSLGFSAKAQPKHTWHLSTIPSSCCLMNGFDFTWFVRQPQPQAALRNPVYPISVIDFVPNQNQVTASSLGRRDVGHRVLDPLCDNETH